MKSPIAYYLMLLYATVMLKPVLPVVADTFSHYFYEHHHEEVVHAKHGEHHLDIEIAKSSEENNSNKSPRAEQSGNLIPLHVHFSTSSLPYRSEISKSTYPLAAIERLTAIYFLTEPRPPESI